MAKVKQTVKTTTKTRVKTKGKGADYIQCNVCKGSGVIKNWHKTKGK